SSRGGSTVAESSARPMSERLHPGEEYFMRLALREAELAPEHEDVPIGAVVYVTLEPCAMCAGALVLARVGRVVFAASDPKAGACGSVLDITGDTRLNHRPVVDGGLLAAEGGAL